MKRLKAVIFDLDDTLYLEKDYVISGFRAVADHIAPMIKVEPDIIVCELINLFSFNINNVFNRFIDNHQADQVLLDKCISVYRNHMPVLVLPDETRELLEYLKSNDYVTGLITDGRPDGQRNKIAALQLEKYMDCIVITDELGGIEFRKPNPTAYLYMLSKLGIEAREAIYVGDNPVKDFIAPNSLGMLTIRLCNKNALRYAPAPRQENDAQIVINRLIEIKDIVLSFGERDNANVW